MVRVGQRINGSSEDKDLPPAPAERAAPRVGQWVGGGGGD